ncbi:ABC transporter ATP-binding protein [Candidatus Deferrimicrobium sp.]|uniref:ABC transporter ATP-binding protein n=1 Tax=Candidatus Deferrimicrobium sp. TaxID=3060586 RepID=UPI003C411CCE
MLEIRGLEVAFGDIQVLWGIDLDIREGEIVSLVGSNGAGKSTLIRTISGLTSPLRGEILYNGKDITGLKAPAIVRLGISQVPEGRKLFFGMTARENLVMGAYCRTDRAGIEADLRFIYELFPRLEERRKQLTGTMSGGEQQMCAIGRALMTRPKLLLIDELSLGLSPLLVENLLEAIGRIYEKWGTSILLVEQDVHTALEYASRGYVLETGRIVLSGSSKDLLSNPQIMQSYLGI